MFLRIVVVKALIVRLNVSRRYNVVAFHHTFIRGSKEDSGKKEDAYAGGPVRGGSGSLGSKSRFGRRMDPRLTQLVSMLG